MTGNILWISWERHRRSQNISKQLNIPLLEAVSTFHGLRRYWGLTVCTWRHVSSTLPRILIVQNPSVVLTAFAILCKPLFKYKLIIDAHNEAVCPYNYNSLFVRTFAKLAARIADCTIVTNSSLSHLIETYGGRPFILPDPIPFVPIELPKRILAGPVNLTLIATYAPDEPIATILEVTAWFGNRIHLYLTGSIDNAKKAGINELPSNAEFTGYLSEKNYWAQLAASDAVIDITVMPDCLVCGAYEAVAVGVPMLLADDSASRKMFSKGTVFVATDFDSMRKGFEDLLNNLPKLKQEVNALKPLLLSSWIVRKQELIKLFERLTNNI